MTQERSPHSSSEVDRVDYWLSDAPAHASREFLGAVAADDARMLAARVRELEEQLEAFRAAVSPFAQELSVGGGIGSAIESMETRDWDKLAAVCFPASEPEVS